MADKKVWIATGRRKRSVAKVTMTLGKGTVVVNDQDIHEYLPYETLYMDLIQPFELTDTMNKFDLNITVNGGGFNGQTGAIRLGITRALLEFDSSFRETLKSAGMVTRDPRIKERKKYGLKKARKAPQFSKR